MSTTETERTQPAPVDEGPVPRRWTREEYYRLGEQGLFQNQRVQLINGEIVVMSPMGTRHAAAVGLVSELFTKQLAADYHVRCQLPFTFTNEDEPEPDVAITEGGYRDFLHHHPNTAVLVVEVSESTLQYDRTVKRKLYAANGLPEYWIVNLKDRQIEVCSAPKSGDYENQTIHKSGDEISVQALPEIVVKVADLLP